MFRRQISTGEAPEGWQPVRREHGGLRPVRRTKEDKQLTFQGQSKDEKVVQVVRQHPIFLLRPALPALGILALLLFFSVVSLRLPDLRAFLALIDVVLAIALLASLAYFVWRDFSIWWFNFDIVTTKRIVSLRGFLTPTRKNIPLDKIVQISVAHQSATSIFLSFGDVHIYQVGGQYVMKNVSRPREVRDALQGAYEQFKAASKGAPAEPPPKIVDPEIQAIIQKLGKKDQEPKLPDADDRYAHRRDPSKLRGPLRTFGGPLNIPAEVHYTSDEHTVMYIQRSKWLLLLRLSGPIFALLALLVITFLIPLIAPITVVGAVAALIVMGLVTVNFVDDVFILSNKRLINIQRKFIFLEEEHEEVEYKNIRETKVKMDNIFQTIFDVGSVIVETVGSQPNIDMTMISHPFFIADKINEVKGFKEKHDKVKAKNSQKDELVSWFTNVAAVLERKIVSRGVPNLQKMDLWTAASMAAEMGMKVLPVGEDDAYPHIEPGRIVAQNPLPGTLMATDQTPTIQVVLSKRSG